MKNYILAENDFLRADSLKQKKAKRILNAGNFILILVGNLIRLF